MVIPLLFSVKLPSQMFRPFQWLPFKVGSDMLALQTLWSRVKAELCTFRDGPSVPPGRVQCRHGRYWAEREPQWWLLFLLLSVVQEWLS